MKRIFLLVSITLTLSYNIYSQIIGNSLVEYQSGKLPQDTVSYSTIYQRTVLQQQFKKIKIGVTVEGFESPYRDRNYLQLSQWLIQQTHENLEWKIGHFYETAGRGLLLRSFDVPGAILQDLSYKSRHYFNRDIQGAMIKYRTNGFTVKAVAGRPLNYLFPPTEIIESRRPDLTFLVSGSKQFAHHEVALLFNQLVSNGKKFNYASFYLSGSLTPEIQYHVENAIDLDLNNHSRSLYANVTYTKNALGMSLELKHYNQFLLGAGLNEPPALVKEHQIRVLNRSTHVLNPIHENGYQWEVFYTKANGDMLTFNHTLAQNIFSSTFTFQEYYLEYSGHFSENNTFKAVVDFAQDPFKAEENRISGAWYSEWALSDEKTLVWENELQTFSRFNDQVLNALLVLGLQNRSKWLFNTVIEWSNDPNLTSNGRFWVGGNARYQINTSNTIQLFAGNRRGGPACNAGICYEVLDFSGVELRFTARL